MPHEPRIDGDALERAITGHIERLDVQDADGLHLALEAENIDSVEMATMGQALRDLRDVQALGYDYAAGWAGGLTDGIVIGVRAARIAAERAHG